MSAVDRGQSLWRRDGASEAISRFARDRLKAIASTAVVNKTIETTRMNLIVSIGILV